MDIKKRMGIYISIFIIVLSFLTYLSKDSNNFIAITTDRESVDIFNKNHENIFLYKKEKDQLKVVKMFPYLNDFMNTDSDVGNYLIEVKENDVLTQRYEVKKNKEEPLKYYLNYIPKSDSIKNNIFFNTLTCLFLLYNLRLLYTFKKEILRKKELIFPIVLVCLKIILTNSEVFSNTFLSRTNLLITSLLGLYLLLYVKNKSDKLKNDIFINIILWILFLMYYIGEIIMLSAVLDRKILNYLVINYFFILKISIFFYVWVDALIIILLMFLLNSVKIKKKQIIKQIEKKNLAMIGSFIVLSLVVELFINNNKYFYYLNMFEFVYIFWYIFLTDVNTMGKIKILTLKMFQMFLHVYIFFVITESVWIAVGIVFSFLTLNLYTYFITGTLRVNKNYIENLINRMYLTKNSEEFKEQLSKELKKNLELRDVKVKIFLQRDDYKKILLDRIYDEDEIILEKNDIINKKYDYAVRLKANKNPFVGLILLQNNDIKLVYEEKRYLEEIVEKLSLVATKYRFEKLQEELS
ncbi:hypothetical protein [Cetobacterium sp.]|uniref:hypothetical protein n=1 Tax=Cetobacterium sp. TaxID=2071632 RepID=UPI0025B8D7B0|nr:hypothetical protein [Cetobacterium sp.]